VTITEFLQARLDETEAAAKAATEVDGQWFTPGPGAGEWAVRQNKAIVDCPAGIVVFDEGCPTDEQAAHIALHDPARVLREVEAGRKILAEHVPVRHQGRLMCATCLAACTFWPCPTLLALAAVHRDHPDWREDWLVT